MNQIRIGSRVISCEQPVLVIAEIGVNHDGAAGRALDLVRFAQRAGADAVKLQIFSADRLVHDSAALASYQSANASAGSASAMLKRCELKPDDVKRVVDLIRKSDMIPIATPFSVEDVELIDKLDLPAIKIASPDIVNRPLLEAAIKTKRAMIVSTGAATIEEVEASVKFLLESGSKFVLLHCISSYPTADAEANLCWIEEMRERFDVPIGFSDHTTELLAGALATSAGAVVVEKHLTYDRAASGPDHAASANPTEFAKYVSAVRLAQSLRGMRGKKVLDCEREVRKISRQSIVAARDITAGSSISLSDLKIQRPGTGVPAGEMSRVIGKKSRRTIAAGSLLQWDMLADAA